MNEPSVEPAGPSSGELRFGRPANERPRTLWKDIKRSRKRLLIDCNHGSSNRSAARKEIGGVTSDRAYDLEGKWRFLNPAHPSMRFTCPGCRRVWEVPMASLQQVAQHRGPRLARRLVQEFDGVSLAE